MKIPFLDGTTKEVSLEAGVNLRGADLGGANLCDANLCGATLCGADLGDANLRSADLGGATLCDADLGGATLCDANLRSADLGGANLCGANLCGANLRNADLRNANLRNANLYGANLRNANLYGANLRSADLRGADLGGANLTNAKGLYTFNILPAGDLIGYKKLGNGAVATLKIPAEAARVNAYGSRKCRAAYVRVISGEGPGIHDSAFLYAPGKLIRPDRFDPDPRVECSNGIHFFITHEEAEEYPV